MTGPGRGASGGSVTSLGVVVSALVGVTGSTLTGGSVSLFSGGGGALSSGGGDMTTTGGGVGALPGTVACAGIWIGRGSLPSGGCTSPFGAGGTAAGWTSPALPRSMLGGAGSFVAE